MATEPTEQQRKRWEELREKFGPHASGAERGTQAELREYIELRRIFFLLDDKKPSEK